MVSLGKANFASLVNRAWLLTYLYESSAWWSLMVAVSVLVSLGARLREGQPPQEGRVALYCLVAWGVPALLSASPCVLSGGPRAVYGSVG